MSEPQPLVRSVRIGPPRPTLSFQRENFLLLDPEQPKADPNELLKLQRGQLVDPNAINHNCPGCNVTMSWPLFKAHALACYAKWRKVKLDITHRVFKGGGPTDA